MRLLHVVLVLAACGQPSANGDDDAATHDGSVRDDARDDGGGDAMPAGDAGPGDADGGDGGIATACTQPRKPTQVTTVTSPSSLNFDNEVFSAGDQVFAMPPLANGTVWLRWTGTGWSEEAIPWPANLPAPRTVDRAVQTSTGKVVIVAGRYLTTFDGVAMTPAVQLPAIGAPWAYAQAPDGTYHVFHGAQESVSKPDGTWHPAAPVPVQKLSTDPTAAATVMADGRIVVVYVNQVFGNDPRHVHVISRKPNTLWTPVVDITPTWAVQAYGPYAFAPRGGGVVIGATGAGAVLWRSADGVTFGDYEPLGLIRVVGVAGPCLDALVATAGYQTRYDLLRLQGTTWSILESRSINYINDAHVAMLPDGRTFWVLGETNRVEYFATPP